MSFLDQVGKFFGEGGDTSSPSWEGFTRIPRLHTFLPYESYDEKTQLFFNRGSTGFVLLGSPLVGASLKDQGQMADFLRQEHHLPEGTSLQFLLHASPKIQPCLDFWKDAREGDIFEKLADKRITFLEKKAFEDEEGHLVRDFRLLISYTVPGLRWRDEDKDHLQEVRKSFQGVLQMMGLPTHVMNAEDLMREVGNILNFTESTEPEKVCWNPFESLSRQIIAADQSFAVEPHRVVLGEGTWQCQSWTPRRYPRQWALGYMDKFLGDMLESSQVIPCPYLIHYGLFMASHQGARKMRLNGKRESLENGLKNRMTKWMPGLQERYQDVSDAVKETQEGERFVLTCFNVTTFCRPAEKSRVEQNLRRIWTSLGWAFSEALQDHLTVLLASLPMTGVEEQRTFLGKKTRGMIPVLERLGKGKMTLTREAQNMLPLLGEWKGQPTPGMLLVGRRGQPFYWSPFGKALVSQGDTTTNHNYNLCLAGTMGSGKSVFMDDLMSSVLGVGGRVIVLDKGRSFKNACLLLGGQHIEFTLHTPLSLNPFTLIPEGDSPPEQENREEMLQAIVPVLEVMASPHHGTTDAQYNHLAKAVQGVWKAKKSQACLEDVVTFLTQARERDARDVAHLLYQYSREGSYGRFFNSPANVSLNQPLVVIETDDLRSHDRLLAVVMQMMILQVNQLIAKSKRDAPFIIMVDEAWEMLKGKKTGEFINAVTRTARKYKGSLVLASQSPHDFFQAECPGATIAWKLSHWKGILSQDDAAIQGMKGVPELAPLVESPFRESLLGSLRSHPPHYSEIALFGQGISGIVGRLRLDPYSRLLYSSHPDEYRLIKERLDQGKTLDHAIEEVMKLQEGRAA